MPMHFVGYHSADGGSWTACGVYSPPARRRGPRHMVYPLTMTDEIDGVTCKRCKRSEKFRLCVASKSLASKRAQQPGPR